MVLLEDYKKYWESMKGRIPEIKSVVPLVVDDDMAKRLQTLPPADSPAIFIFPPSARTSGYNVDSISDVCEFLVLVLARFDRQRKTAWSVLSETQSLAEKVRDQLIADSARACSPVDVDINSISMMAETGFYGVLAGWSIAFKSNDDGI